MKIFVFSIFSLEKPRKRNLSTFSNTRWGQTILYEKCHFSLDMDFLVSESYHPPSNFTWRTGCFLSNPRCQKMLNFLRWSTLFRCPPPSYCFGASSGADGRIQLKTGSFLTPFDRHALYLFPRGIWGWFVYFSFEKQVNSTRKKKKSWKL